MTEAAGENGNDKRIVQIIPADGRVAVYQVTPNLRVGNAAYQELRTVPSMVYVQPTLW